MNEVTRHEAEAEAARARIVSVVEELADRLSPQTIVRKAKAEARQAVMDVRDESLRKILDVRDRAADAVEEVEDFIRDNAVPMGLAAAAVGVAIAVATRGGEAHHDHYADAGGDEYTRYARGDEYAADAIRPRLRPLIDRARSGLSGVGHTVSDAASRAGRAATAAKTAAAERLRRASTSMGEGVTSAGERIATGMDRMRDHATDTADAAARAARTGAVATGDAISDNPEASVLLAMAGGALLALMAAESPTFGAGTTDWAEGRKVARRR